MAMTKFEINIRTRAAAGGDGAGFALPQCVC